MECFYHPATAAVVLCKSCGRGLCHGCAIDIGKGMACQGRCESDARAVTTLIDRGIQNSPRARKIANFGYRSGMGNAGFYLLIGLFFLGFAIYRYVQYRSSPADVFSGGLGILFIGYGLFLFNRARSYRQISALNDES